MATYKLTAPERETTISMNDEDEFALVTSHQKPVIRQLKANTAAELVGTDNFGGHTFRLPAKLINIRKPYKRKATA
jgi:uncharacterized pyridoxamine 5'-phosphate oxidase family protein